MGVNGENPQVDPAADTKPDEGDPTPPVSSDSVEQNRIGVLEKEVLELRREVENLLEQKSKADDVAVRWKQGLGIDLRTEPDKQLDALRDERKALIARNGDLQSALGIGGDGDPYEAVAEIKESAKGDLADELSGLPFYGVLLLTTAIVRHKGEAGYAGTPSSISVEGDEEWFAQVDETSDGRVVEVSVRRGQYTHLDAVNETKKAETDLAETLRLIKGLTGDLQRMAEGPRDDVAEKAYRDRLATMKKRRGELEATVRKLKPLVSAPQQQTWRFSGEIEDFGQGEL